MRFRTFKLTCLLLLTALMAGPSVPTQSKASENLPALVKAPYEVRLRKLHLVRPDLIPYPINFEVYC
jgi:hypothetical protein